MASKQFGYQGQDDSPGFVVRQDMSGGMNTRQHGTIIGENQAESLDNMDISIPGERKKRKGSVTIGSALEAGQSVTNLASFIINGATNQLLAFCNNKLYKSEDEGASAEITGFTFTSTPGFVRGKKSGVSPDDVMWICDGTNNWWELQSDGTVTDLGDNDGSGTTDSPPESKVGAWYGNRFYVLLNDQLYFSDAYDTDYSTSFDTTTNTFRIPVGKERALLATRDLGLVCAGNDGIWAIAPSATPAATDKPEPLLTNLGPVSNGGIISANDDIYFFAKDGLRALKRTVQDKLQMGVSYPLSYQLKTQFEEIAWDSIANLSMEYFDNKIFISVPLSESTYRTWIYYPATQGFTVMSDVNPRCFAKHAVDGEERLYYGSHGDGKVQRGWYGYTDEGTVTTDGTEISMTEIGRKEDFGDKLRYKLGGDIELRMGAVGNYTATVYAQFDDGGYNELGTLSLSSSGGADFTGVDGKINFPITFTDSNTVQVKIPIDSYGRWRHCQIKITHTESNDANDIIIYQVSVIAYMEEYQNV